MNDASRLDALFREAVAAMDAGDIAAIERLTKEHPRLVHERLRKPGAWLRDTVGGALNGFFKEPYLLWFVAEDPVRNDTLPRNVAEIAQIIIDAARRENAANLQEQLDYALNLVAWSWVAHRCGVQLELIDTLVAAGASTQGALTLAALNGRAEALVRLLALNDVDVNAVSPDLYSHATPLHHAVCSGSLDAVKALVDHGAKLTITDTAYGGTPLGWAEHYVSEAKSADALKKYREIADYLHTAMSK